MKKIFLVILLSGLVAGFISYSVLAQLILSPSNDTYTDLNYQATNFDGQALIAEYSSGPCTVSRRVYLQYDLSSLPIDVGPQTTVRVYISMAAATDGGNLAIWSTGDDWNGALAGNGDETTLTWTNAPAPIQQLDTKPSGTTSAWVEFTGANLSSFINGQRSANGGDNIASFVIQWSDCVDTVGDVVVIEDREGSLGTGNTPQLYPRTPTAITLSSLTVTSGSSITMLLVTAFLIVTAAGAFYRYYRKRAKPS